MELTLKEKYNQWDIVNKDNYDLFNLPEELWPESADYKPYGYFYPIYFPIGLLVKYMRSEGMNITINY